MINTLIETQDKIIKFLMEGTKGTLDFRNNPDFYNSSVDRGIYPRRNLHLLEDAGVTEKLKINRKVHWRLMEGAYFRMEGKEYEWSYTNPKITEDETYLDLVEVEDEISVETAIEITEYPYLVKVKEAMSEPKKWLKKVKIWD